MSRAIDARDSSGSVMIPAAVTLDEALTRADELIREFVGNRDFTFWQTRSEPLMTVGGGVLGWDVEVSWRVIS